MGTRYLGLISGTSIDGVDACIAEFRAHRCHILGARTTPYPPQLRKRVQALITAPEAPLREIGALDVALGRFFGVVTHRHRLDTGRPAARRRASTSTHDTIIFEHQFERRRSLDG